MLTIIVPIHNEREALRQFLAELAEAVGACLPCEVLLVDDGSTDGGLDGFTSPDGWRVLRHRRCRGYGAAIKSAVRESAGEWIAIIDADLTYHPRDLATLWNAREPCDMVVGARRVHHDSPQRGAAKGFLRRLAQYLAGQRIPDLNSGLRLMRASVLRSFLHLLPNGFSLTTTVTLAFLCNGYDVEYVEIDYRCRVGRSKIHPGRDPGRFFMLMVRTILLFNPLKVLAPLSLVLFLAAVAVIFTTKFVLRAAIPDITVSMLILLAVQTLLLGLLADLLSRQTRIDPPA